MDFNTSLCLPCIINVAITTKSISIFEVLIFPSIHCFQYTSGLRKIKCVKSSPFKFTWGIAQSLFLSCCAYNVDYQLLIFFVIQTTASSSDNAWVISCWVLLVASCPKIFKRLRDDIKDEPTTFWFWIYVGSRECQWGIRMNRV